MALQVGDVVMVRPMGRFGLAQDYLAKVEAHNETRVRVRPLKWAKSNRARWVGLHAVSIHGETNG